MAPTVIATGSRPARTDSFDALGDRVIVSDDVFDWQALPKSVAVIGSGIMAERLSGSNVAVALLGNTAATGAMLFVLITMLGPDRKSVV